MKNWLVALQNPYNEIKFITNHSDTPSFLPYKEFFSKIINQYKVIELQKYTNVLDEIGRVVVLNLDTGTWEKKMWSDNPHTFEELYKLNIEAPQKLSKMDKYKNFLDGFTRKHDGLRNRRF